MNSELEHGKFHPSIDTACSLCSQPWHTDDYCHFIRKSNTNFNAWWIRLPGLICSIPWEMLTQDGLPEAFGMQTYSSLPVMCSNNLIKNVLRLFLLLVSWPSGQTIIQWRVPSLAISPFRNLFLKVLLMGRFAPLRSISEYGYNDGLIHLWLGKHIFHNDL